MKSVRKRYHDLGGKLNSIVISIDCVIDLLEAARDQKMALNQEELLHTLKVGADAAQVMDAELKKIKTITYKLCNPDDDLDNLLEPA